MCCYVVFFFFKQKTAYEMRISDWSSDVCSSDLPIALIVARWRLKRRHRIRGCPEHKALAWKSYWPMQWLPEAWRCLRPAPRCRLVSRVAAGRPDQDAGRKVCSAGRHPVRIVLLI